MWGFDMNIYYSTIPLDVLLWHNRYQQVIPAIM